VEGITTDHDTIEEEIMIEVVIMTETIEDERDREVEVAAHQDTTARSPSITMMREGDNVKKFSLRAFVHRNKWISYTMVL